MVPHLPNLTVRRAVDADAPALVDLLHRAFQQYSGVLDPPSGVHAETIATVRSKMSTGTWLLVERGRMPVGCVWYEPRGDYVYLGRLSVPPEFRGQGIANALLDAVEQQARGSGISSIRLAVRIVLDRMRAAYERRGYRVFEYETHPGYAEPTYVIMEKVLHSP